MGKKLIWNTTGSIFYFFCQWVITILVVRLGNLELSGFLNIAISISGSFAAISLFSMRNYQISDLKGEYSTGQYVSSRLWTSLIALMSCGIYAYIGVESLTAFLCVMAFMFVRIAEAFVDVLHGINQKHEHYDYIGISFILRGLLTIASFVAGVLLTGDLVITLGIMAICNLTAVFLYDFLRTSKLEKIKVKLWDKGIVGLIVVCLPIVVYDFLRTQESTLPRAIAMDAFGADALGVYGAMAAPAMIVPIFAQMAFNPFIPGCSKLIQEGAWGKFRSIFHKLLLGMVAMCIVVHLGAMLLGRFGLELLFSGNHDILDNYYLFLPIVWCTILMGIIMILTALVVALRQNRWLLIGIIVNFGIFLALAWPMVRNFGMNGVSIVQIIVYALLILFLAGVVELTSRKGITKAS